MRVTSIEIFSDDIEILSFSLNKPDPSLRYHAKHMVGIDADELVAKFYSYGETSKMPHYEVFIPSRDIVIRLALNPNHKLLETNSDLRDEVYRAISLTRHGLLDILFKNGPGVVAKVSGHITKVEALHFSALAEVQITIKCEDGLIRGVNPVVLGPTDLGSSAAIIVADSHSTAPHGMLLQVQFTSNTPNFQVRDQLSNREWNFSVTPSGGFLTGDQLTIMSEIGKYEVYLVRSGVRTNLMDKISPSSTWPVIFPKNNPLYFAGRATFNFIELSYYPAYWGV